MKKRKKTTQLLWWHGRLAVVLGALLVISIFAVHTISDAYAESYEFEETSVRLISYDKSAPADGKTAIRFTVEFFGYKCSRPDWRGVYILYPRPEYCNDSNGEDYGPSTGTVVRTNADSPYSGNATTTGTINSNGFGSNLTGGKSIGHPHHQVIYPGPDGRITLHLTSTVAEKKHIHVDNGNISDPNSIEFDVTFTQVAGVKPVPVNPNAPPPSSALGSTPQLIPVGEPSETTETEKLLKIATVRVNDIPISKNNQKQEIQHSKDIVLSGTAAPNAVVTLYIFSDPQVTTVTADANGLWSYTVKGLVTGDHHVETEVLDPATNTKTKRINLTSFRIVSASGESLPSQDTDSIQRQPKLSPFFIIVIAILLTSAVSFILSRHPASAHIFDKKVSKIKHRTNRK